MRHSRLAPDLFADFYRLWPARAGRPLVCFWGGAITPTEYELCRRTEPDVIAAEWIGAVGRLRLSPDLLVFALPDVERCNSVVLRRWLVREFEDVLSECPDPCPEALGFIGHSAGAFAAASLALDLPQARALATLGGVGMTVALLDAREPSGNPLEVAVFANKHDPCTGQTRAFITALRRRGLQPLVRRGAGGHELAAYIANGSLRRAFAFVAARRTGSAGAIGHARKSKGGRHVYVPPS